MPNIRMHTNIALRPYHCYDLSTYYVLHTIYCCYHSVMMTTIDTYVLTYTQANNNNATTNNTLYVCM